MPATTASGIKLLRRKLRCQSGRMRGEHVLDDAIGELDDRPHDALDDAKRSLDQGEEELAVSGVVEQTDAR